MDMLDDQGDSQILLVYLSEYEWKLGTLSISNNGDKG